MSNSIKSVVIMLPDGSIIHRTNQKKINKMISPVECRRCGMVYDLCDGKPIHRYADCTTYITPCCNHMVDDREWVSNPAFTRITRD